MNIDTLYQNVNILACTSELPEKDWFELRKIGIGGSDIAGILGISKYNTPLSIYMTKVTDVEQVENKHTKFGKRMEPVIREWICDEFYEKNNILLYTMPFPYFMQSKNYVRAKTFYEEALKHQVASEAEKEKIKQAIAECLKKSNT